MGHSVRYRYHVAIRSDHCHSYRALNVVYLLGEEDTCNEKLLPGCHSHGLETRCEDMFEGTRSVTHTPSLPPLPPSPPLPSLPPFCTRVWAHTHARAHIGAGLCIEIACADMLEDSAR